MVGTVAMKGYIFALGKTGDVEKIVRSGLFGTRQRPEVIGGNQEIVFLNTTADYLTIAPGDSAEIEVGFSTPNEDVPQQLQKAAQCTCLPTPKLESDTSDELVRMKINEKNIRKKDLFTAVNDSDLFTAVSTDLGR